MEQQSFHENVLKVGARQPRPSGHTPRSSGPIHCSYLVGVMQAEMTRKLLGSPPTAVQISFLKLKMEVPKVRERAGHASSSDPPCAGPAPTRRHCPAERMPAVPRQAGSGGVLSRCTGAEEMSTILKEVRLRSRARRTTARGP